MTDCDVCKPDPLPKHSGVPIYLKGTRHRKDCPDLGELFRPDALLNEDLMRIREAEQRAWGFCQTYIFG